MRECQQACKSQGFCIHVAKLAYASQSSVRVLADNAALRQHRGAATGGDACTGEQLLVARGGSGGDGVVAPKPGASKPQPRPRKSSRRASLGPCLANVTALAYCTGFHMFLPVSDLEEALPLMWLSSHHAFLRGSPACKVMCCAQLTCAMCHRMKAWRSLSWRIRIGRQMPGECRAKRQRWSC